MATAFDLGGLLGPAFGGNELDDLLTPQQRQAIQNQSLLSAAAALLQAGGPSRTPISLGQALGGALEAGQTGAQRAQQSALTQMMTRQKMEESRRQREADQRLRNMLLGSTEPTTPAQALAAPGMAPGPTQARAAMIGQTSEPAETFRGLSAAQRQLLAALPPAQAAAEGLKLLQTEKVEIIGEPIQTATGWVQRTKSGGFIQLPKDYEPTVKIKPVGEPLTVTDQASGNQILVQRYDDNTIKPLEGFGPKRDVVLEKVDGKVMAIDKTAVAPGTTFGTGISPADQARLEMEKQRLDMERRRLGISEAEFARSAYERVETAQGIVYVPKRPGAPVIPIMDASGKPLMGTGGGKPTEGELNAAGFAQRMERAGGIISNLPTLAETSMAPAVAGRIPLIGGVAQRLAQTDQQQQYKQAADDWIRAKLRKESGAVIGEEEMKQEYITYFPQIGDSEAVKRQKADARRIATEAMRTSAGRAYQPYVAPPSAPGAPQEGQESKDKSGRPIVYRNNRWEYK
jgi:hypothetical protein